MVAADADAVAKAVGRHADAAAEEAVEGNLREGVEEKRLTELISQISHVILLARSLIACHRE